MVCGTNSCLNCINSWRKGNNYTQVVLYIYIINTIIVTKPVFFGLFSMFLPLIYHTLYFTALCPTSFDGCNFCLIRVLLIMNTSECFRRSIPNCWLFFITWQGSHYYALEWYGRILYFHCR